MSQDHELAGAQLHETLEPKHPRGQDMTGAPLSGRRDSTSKYGLDEKPSQELSDRGSDFVTPDGEEPTEHEKSTLRHIGEWLPARVWLIAIVELCERFTYYGMQGLFQNYARHPEDGSLGRAGLGLGKTGATGLNVFFQFWCYVTPILGAIIADEFLGRYRTILIFCAVYICGLIILTVTSVPSIMYQGNAGIAGFVVALLVVGLGTGGIKSNVAPLIAEQYTRRVQAVKTNKKGERVIIDPAVTIQRIYMIFYGCINLGSLSLIATPYMEQDIGFWSAYLMCLCMFIVGTIIFVVANKFVIKRAPRRGVITNAFRCVFMLIKGRNRNAAKPSYLEAHGKSTTVPWDDRYVDEVVRALMACKIFLIYPIYWVCYGQFSNNFVSQAEEMDGHGIPNDFMQNFDPISIIVFIPILDRIIYPLLRKAHIEFRPVARICFGFWVVALAMAYAAITQHYIYLAGPCYSKPLTCNPGPDGVYPPNNIHIAIQTPAYVLIGLSEIFASVTGLEYAFTKAPLQLKSFIQSLFLFTNAIGAAISEAFLPVVGDPAILWLFTGLACAAASVGTLGWFLFHHYDHQEDAMNKLDAAEAEQWGKTAQNEQHIRDDRD